MLAAADIDISLRRYASAVFADFSLFAADMPLRCLLRFRRLFFMMPCR